MNIYLDSARVGSWTLPAGCPPVRGVTTNPTLVHQAGISVTLDSYDALVQAAADHGMAELMLQLPMSEPAEALRWQARLHTRARHAGVQLTIKLPCHPDWLPVIHAMREHESDYRPASAIRARDMRDRSAIRKQPFEFAFAPAVAKRYAVKCCKRGGIARACVEDRRFRAAKELQDAPDHSSGMR